MSSDKEMQNLYWLEKMALYDENTRIGVARQEGLNAGKKEKQIEIAKELLKLEMNTEDIQKVTKLTKEEIEKLK